MSSDPEQPGSPPPIDLFEGHENERAERWLHRIGWALFAAIIVAALAGLFGQGPLSQASAERPGLRVEYDRFTRHHAPAELRIDVGGISGDSVDLHLGKAFLDSTELQSIQPQPDKVSVDARGQRFTFNVGELGRGQARILVQYQPDKLLTDIPVTLSVDDRPEIRFSQFVYP